MEYILAVHFIFGQPVRNGKTARYINAIFGRCLIIEGPAPCQNSQRRL